MAGLRERYERWPHADFSLSQDVVGRGRNYKRRARAPNQLSGLAWRQEERRVHVTEAIFTAGGLGGIRLPYKWLNNPCNQVPSLIQLDRNNRLNVQDVLCPVEGTDAEVAVVL